MSLSRTALLAAAAAAFALAGAGCSTSRTIVPWVGPDGRPEPFVYRHAMRAKDVDSRASIAGALVGVKSSDDPVWQVAWTDENGGAALSQEYADQTMYNDRRSLFFVETENVIRLRAPAFQLNVFHPNYDPHTEAYGPPSFLDRPREAAGFAYAELVRPVLCPLDRKEGAPTPTAAPRPSFADLVQITPSEITGNRVGGIGGGAFQVGAAVHGGRFERTTGASAKRERATKLYHRSEDGALVLLGDYDTAAEGGASVAAIAALCDTADLVLYAPPETRLPGVITTSRWVVADRDQAPAQESRVLVAMSALEAGLAAGAKHVALFYPLRLAPDIDRKLRERRFELLAEWWLSFD